MAGLKARLLGGWLGDQLLRDAAVEQIEELGPGFRRISLAGPALREVSCAAGDKLQIFLPDAGTRAYTPFAFDAAAGRLDLLAYLHGSGPAATWARRLEPGARVRIFGPRSSLALASFAGPLALFGDETSFAVARSLLDLRAASRDVTVRLEVASLEEAEPVRAALALPPDSLVSRRDDASHLEEIAKALHGATSGGGTLVLTGNAQTLQRLRGQLRALGSRAPQKVKAYWAAGKRGLD